MREIKFRAKNVMNGEWVCGDLVHYNHSHTHISIAEKECKEQYFVHPETICQFTGLQDSKGNDIYEGDILCIRQHELDILRCVFRETEINCVVEFRNGSFIPVMSDGRGYCWSNLIYDKLPTADYTVIGNIHDNPEMMEVSQ